MPDASSQASPKTPGHLAIQKTCKLFIGGAFPRSESGRTMPIISATGESMGHASKASRKDLRDAVLAARKGLASWSGMTPVNRGQILYRLAELLQTHQATLVNLLSEGTGISNDDATSEVRQSLDRLVHYAGWCDKWTQCAGSTNSVSGPYWNISTPEPVGVVIIAGPGPGSATGTSAIIREPLLSLVSLMAPALAAGCSVIILTQAYVPLMTLITEVIAASDFPAGSVNLLTGELAELVPVAAQHRDVEAMITSHLSADLVKQVDLGRAENLKRITQYHTGHDLNTYTWNDDDRWCNLACILACSELKTAWHPVGT
jgi:acyl-CoA reductase-like NAD-dependent aldehyde dehydrogenase